MARGAGNISQNQAQQSSAESGQLFNQENQTLQPLTNEYMNMVNQGYTPAQQSAMTVAGETGAASPFNTAAQTAENKAAATRNQAGSAAQEDKLAMEKGEATGQEAGNLQTQFANKEQQNTWNALNGLQQIGTTYGNQSIGQAGEVAPNVNATTQANDAWMGLLGNALGAGGSALGGIFQGKG